jgi:uncharacterized protein (DUF58 family)
MVKLELDFLPHLKQLEDLTKKPWLVSLFAGEYQSTFRGSGHEFETYEQYTPDQDAKRIDWIASAKSNKIFMRAFTEERDLRIFTMLDVSSSMFFSSTKKLKCEYAAELVNSLLFAVIAAGDQAGLLMTSTETKVFVPPKSDKSQYFRLLNQISTNEHYGGQRDIFWGLKQILTAKERGVLFIVSDFIRTTREEFEIMGLLAKKFDIYAFVIRDRFEKFLPSDVNAVCIEDPRTHKTIIVNLKQVRDEYQMIMEEDERRLKDQFLQHNVDMKLFYTHHPFEAKLMQFFSHMRRRWK